MLNPLPLTIPHAAMMAASRWGDAPALLEGGEQWSFDRLWADCRRAASAFLAHGIGHGDRIAIWAPNSREWIVAAVGAMAAGAAIVPLNTRLKGREAGDILRRTSARMLLTAGNFLDIDYPALIAREDLPALRETVLIDTSFDAFLAGGAGADDPAVPAAMARIGPDDISDIMFTSGTTGSPKGVLMTHGRILPQCGAWIANTRLGEGERYLLVNPFFHSFGTKVGWVACLLAGAVIVPMPQFDAKAAARLIAQDGIAFLPGPPTIFQMLLEENMRAPFDTGSLRGGTTGAATVPPILIEQIRETLGMRDIITAYGMTECVTITSCRPGDPADLIARSCGRAMPDTELRIVDEAGRPLPAGGIGEVLVRGSGVMLGYLDDPAATADAIDTDGWLHTGDIGSIDQQGYLTISDRKKDVYISGGFNCYPAEIERIMAEHPAIAMVAVIGVADARLGEVGKAFVVKRLGADLGEAELSGWARENMANYKVPRTFVILPDLPRNATGKVVKDDLR